MRSARRLSRFSSFGATSHTGGAGLHGALARVLLLVPVALMIWLGWQRRWTADDAFINLRIVRQFQHGNGLSLNIGDRLEAGTSPLWIIVLSIADVLLPFRLEWIAVILGLAATAGGLLLITFASARMQYRAGVAGTTVPLGVLIYAVLSPAWDYATSGLENGLGVLWIGGCWWVLSARVGAPSDEVVYPPVHKRMWAAGLLVGLGPFVRPDFAIFTLAFIVGLVLLGDRSRRQIAKIVAWCLLIPVAGSVARVVYYGIPVPNTAVAKEASKSHLTQGLKYAWDFVIPYALFVPIILVAVVFVLPTVRRSSSTARPQRVLVIVAVSAAVVHAAYIVRVGGDFMHGRMLLAPLLVGLLPIAVVPVSRGRGWVQPASALVVIVWAVVCLFALRTPYSGSASGTTVERLRAARSADARIADERLYYSRYAGVRHPVTLDDYRNSAVGQGLENLRQYLEPRPDALLFVGDAGAVDGPYALNPATDAKRDLVVHVGSLGVISYGLPRDVYVVDDHGLAWALASHERLFERRRPGHEKSPPLLWAFAEFAAADVQLPPEVSPLEVAAARDALACGGFPGLFAAAQDDLDVGRAFSNVTGALSRWRFRFHPNPIRARLELCGE